jgi:hypothetical protein
MKPTLLITVASCAFQLAAMPPAQANASDRSGVNKHTGLYELPLSDLRKAAERGDRAELGRTAARMGPGRIAKALADSDRRVVLAALEALPLFDGGVLLLGSTVPLLAATDPGVRAQAARSVDLLLSANDTGSLDAWEITEETVQAVCRALGRLAADDKEETGTRVLAVQGILDAGENCATSAPLARLQTAVAPEIRRAAVLALPIDPNVVPNVRPAPRSWPPRRPIATVAWPQQPARSGASCSCDRAPGNRWKRQLSRRRCARWSARSARCPRT